MPLKKNLDNFLKKVIFISSDKFKAKILNLNSFDNMEDKKECIENILQSYFD